MVITILLIQRKWQPADLETAASQFILTVTRRHNSIPGIAGYERVRVYDIGFYRAGLFRVSPAPLTLASYRLVIYNQSRQPVFALESLESAKEPWTTLYDFAGQHGIFTNPRGHRVYSRDLTSDGEPDAIIGQYSGGSHCCTIATVIELGKTGVRQLARIDGLDGLPFEGLELRKLNLDTGWQIIAHRPYQTVCGSHFDAADVVSIYTFSGGAFVDRTRYFANFLADSLKENLVRWNRARNRSRHLLQTIAAEYAALGQLDEGNRFFASGMTAFVPELLRDGVDPNACLADVASLVDRIANNTPK